MFALNWLTGFRGFFLNIFRQWPWPPSNMATFSGHTVVLT
jgi:hypothetical protein